MSHALVHNARRRQVGLVGQLGLEGPPPLGLRQPKLVRREPVRGDPLARRQEAGDPGPEVRFQDADPAGDARASKELNDGPARDARRKKGARPRYRSGHHRLVPRRLVCDDTGRLAAPSQRHDALVHESREEAASDVTADLLGGRFDAKGLEKLQSHRHVRQLRVRGPDEHVPVSVTGQGAVRQQQPSWSFVFEFVFEFVF
mmetsp:Transcript_61324/g.138825  ORF Transcript_61324/g.138825 Transcript_61324/m.138825 type:complete len:201 (-) Transcript_61324:903-1505(-)